MNRNVEEIEDMLEEAIRLRNEWESHFYSGKLSTKENARALRNYTALRGVVNTLKWVKGLPINPLE